MVMRGPAAPQAKKTINKSTFCILEFEQVSWKYFCLFPFEDEDKDNKVADEVIIEFISH